MKKHVAISAITSLVCLSTFADSSFNYDRASVQLDNVVTNHEYTRSRAGASTKDEYIYGQTFNADASKMLFDGYYVVGNFSYSHLDATITEGIGEDIDVKESGYSISAGIGKSLAFNEKMDLFASALLKNTGKDISGGERLTENAYDRNVTRTDINLNVGARMKVYPKYNLEFSPLYSYTFGDSSDEHVLSGSVMMPITERFRVGGAFSTIIDEEVNSFGVALESKF